jgi:glycosyltransferase involved in cell wall biosynthesis
MKYVIITQIKNQEDRVFEWMVYHMNQGFDSFIIYDDGSEDKTIEEINKFILEFPKIKVFIEKTDGIGSSYNINQCKNSEFYGTDKSLNDRITRSYTKGNQIANKINNESICAFIDVDEFLLTEENKKVVDIIENIFNKNNIMQICIVNFDVKDNYFLKKNFIKENLEYFEYWNDECVNLHPIWKNRVKCVVKSKFVKNISFVHNIVENTPNHTYYVERDYNKLRMLHFRKPNLPNSSEIKFVKNNLICEIIKNNI